MKILIVDYYEEIRLILSEYFIGQGFEVKECSSGNDAIKTMESGEEFELIISDYWMPNGNGLDILNYLIIHNKEEKLIYFSTANNILELVNRNNLFGSFSKYEIDKLFNFVVRFSRSYF